ncbi:hypothetical protein BH10BAC3_BH10BAC3_08020 [soil metagenome]
MKNTIQKTLFAALLVLLAVSCKKEETKVYFDGGTASVLSANQTGTIPMAFVNGSKEAVTFTWTNPNYNFTTGLSSQNVAYNFEIDTVGANFTNPNKKVLVLSKELGYMLTQTALNDIMLNQLSLTVDMPHEIEMRIVSSVAGATPTALPSNVLKFTATPYSIPPKVDPPTEGTLWITGDATKSGWSNPLGTPYDLNQKFTQVTPTLYELTVSLPGGGGYKLIQKQGVWGTQYHMLKGGTWEGGEFEQKDADPAFAGPPAAGNYKLSFDFQKGKFTVQKL